MYEVSYRLSVVRHIMSNYFYYRIRPRGVLCDAERDLLAIAKFLVLSAVKIVFNYIMTL